MSDVDRMQDANELRTASQTLRANPLGTNLSPDAVSALADVLDVIAYVKEYEPYSDYFVCNDDDPAMRVARLINGRET